MQNRAEILTLLTEMRGRIEELERLVRFGPDYAVITPLSYDEPGVEDVTPQGYASFRQTGLQGRTTLDVFTPLDGFVQFASPEAGIQCHLTSFDLSELHRNDAKPAMGLNLVPIGEKQDWFAFEFLNEAIDPKDWLWTEWVLKLSTNAPGTLYSQFILEGEGDPVFVVIGAHEVNEFAVFQHFRLERGMIAQDRLQDVRRVRLVLSTGGAMVPLNIYAFGIYGRR